MEVDVPVGYRFRPRDVELLRPHLKSQVDGRPLTVPIPTLNVYDTDPWSLPPGFQGDDGFFYCFTQLRRSSDKGRRIKRSVGSSGTWYTNNTTVVTGVGGEVVGYRTFLSYQVKRKNTGWVMYEYRLKDGSSSSSSQLQEHVVCKMKNGSKKKPQEQELEPELDVLEGPSELELGRGKRRRVENHDHGGITVDHPVECSSSSPQPSTTPDSVLQEGVPTHVDETSFPSLVEQQGSGGVPTGGTGSSSLGHFEDNRFSELEGLLMREGDDSDDVSQFYFSPEELLGFFTTVEEPPKRDGDDSDIVGGTLQPSTSQGSLPVPMEEGVPNMDETFTFSGSVEQQGRRGVPTGGTKTPSGGGMDHVEDVRWEEGWPGDGDDNIFSSLDPLEEVPHLGDGDDSVIVCHSESLHVTVQEMIPSMDETFSFPSMVEQKGSRGQHPMGGTSTDTPLGGYMDLLEDIRWEKLLGGVFLS